MDEAEYIAGLELIERKDPQHSLLPMLQQGYTGGRAIFMAKVVEELIAAEPTASREEQAKDPQLQGLFRRQSALFGKRAKLSNSFHRCTTNQQRAKVSERIQEVQDRIRSIRIQIEQFLTNGRTSMEVSEKFPVPDGLYAQLKKRNSLRSNISNYKRKLKQLALLPDGHPERQRIDRYEQKLSTHQTHLKHVQNAIDSQ